MANNKLILRAVTSPWNIPTPYRANPIPDFTKGSVLTHFELDNNQLYLKGEIIHTATTVGGIVTLKKINGEEITFNGAGAVLVVLTLH